MPLDIGVGILLSLGVAELFGVEATPLLIVFGIACALLPDIDILTIPLLGKWHHRTHTHFPLVYIPFVILAFIFIDPVYATLFTLGVYAHLVHDTFGIGYGIAWLWPFSKRKFLFFAPTDSVPSDSNWVHHYYFRLDLLAYIEYGVLFVALLLLALHFT